MRRFRFPLAGLEKLLAWREDRARLHAAKAAVERRRATQLLGHLKGLVADAHRDRRSGRAARSLGPQDEQLYDLYFQRLDHAVGTQQDAVAQARDHHAACRTALGAAARRRRVVGLLREHRQAAWRREAARELTRALDEVGARKHQGASHREEPAHADDAPPADLG